MRHEDPILKKVKELLEEKHFEIVGWSAVGKIRVERVTKEWGDYLDGMGARRVGKLMGAIIEADKGHVRVEDPHIQGGNQGFIDMPRETAEKIAALGLP